MTPNNPAAPAPAAPDLNAASRRSLKPGTARPPRAGSRALTPERRAKARQIAAEEAGGILRGGGLLRPRHLAALLGLSPSTLWAMVRDGRLPAPARFGTRCTVWPAASVRDVLAALEPQA